MIGPYWQQEEQQNYEIGHQTKTNMEEESWDDQEKDRHFSCRCDRFLNLTREEEEEEE